MRISLAASASISIALLIAGFASSVAWGHGDVTPQPVNTDALPDIGEAWLTENPYRKAGTEVWDTALRIGSSGYNQNCARCHGLGVISGGLAPDLRFLEAEEYGDEWFIERFRTGYTQNGITKMPAFGELLGQKAAWAIRTYIEARPDNEAMEAVGDRLKKLRDTLSIWAKNPSQARKNDIREMLAELKSIAEGIETLSGAPTADSAPFRALQQLSGNTGAFAKAAETLTIGLSAAQ